MKYAANTTVSIDESQQEIQQLLRKYGAGAFAIDWNNNAIMFELNKHTVRLQVKYPNKEDFRKTEKGILRKPEAINEQYERAKMQSWRVLVLMVKANLEAIESGILTADQVFLPYYVLANGKSVAEQILPQLHNNELPLLSANSIKK